MEAMAEYFGGSVFKYPPKASQISTKHANLRLPPSLQPLQFPSHVHANDISPMAKSVCDILARAPPGEIETALDATGIPANPILVEEVLKYSYNYPASAVKFFRWAGQKHKHSSIAWNLMVDLLGKNQAFEQMWDAMRSMKHEGALSMATFASVFSSYCSAGRVNEAVMSFDVMDQYGIQQDTEAVNLILSAICAEDMQTTSASEVYDGIKGKIPPDGDTFAILLEGWEKEGNVNKAKNTFGEMVVRLGWSLQYMSAYDAFLTTLVRGSHAEEAIKFLQVMKGKNCLPGLNFFSTALNILSKRDDSHNCILFWDIMVGSGLMPNLFMYNRMIGLLCNNGDTDNAFRLLDEMVFHGAFPDSLTYNLIFECLVKNKKVRQAAKFFVEMIKNELPPNHSNCSMAITMFFSGDDPETGVDIWNYMIDNRFLHLDESANALLLGLCALGRFSELKKFAEDVFDLRINIYESTREKLKEALYSAGRRSARDTYDFLSRRWRA
ncbi:pentatricopeptide repeat-containing protein At1g77360, mitochondrial-like [Rhodamnia argentea]|uniref:Pentatricopeptide repeat-containing protein At1g77360, mitochondrial-like n=1 Tax=Rhodamnia argentea TaxID=178133 RepID=A0A8B8Q1I1_9MYRT|nr:pentatricopeptide repeat-containing protein At1g77360, mitochondrial-like [Rhodamnia argentea]XP_048132034.1 pentatricopeptide repeat-containing protein At1g77360, mitochondrial-like [Rhodamnia argentea]XP_048132035.1 pentatricopeptide repeat-containing protein At1g77360, mitochondrial-like [Rhodamnia argentea]